MYLGFRDECTFIRRRRLFCRHGTHDFRRTSLEAESYPARNRQAGQYCTSARLISTLGAIESRTWYRNRGSSLSPSCHGFCLFKR